MLEESWLYGNLPKTLIGLNRSMSGFGLYAPTWVDRESDDSSIGVSVCGAIAGEAVCLIYVELDRVPRSRR